MPPAPGRHHRERGQPVKPLSLSRTPHPVPEPHRRREIKGGICPIRCNFVCSSRVSAPQTARNTAGTGDRNRSSLATLQLMGICPPVFPAGGTGAETRGAESRPPAPCPSAQGAAVLEGRHWNAGPPAAPHSWRCATVRRGVTSTRQPRAYARGPLPRKGRNDAAGLAHPARSPRPCHRSAFSRHPFRADAYPACLLRRVPEPETEEASQGGS